MSARDFGVPPYSRSFSSSSFRKTANFGFFLKDEQEDRELRVLFEFSQRIFRRLLARQRGLCRVQQGAMEFRVGAETLP